MRMAVCLPAVLAALAVLSACGSDYPSPIFIESTDCTDLQHGVLPVTDLTLSTDGIDINLQVEVANNSSTRTQGFMCRESISPGTGMLFTYVSDRTNGFWMFNTYAPIDILYIDQSGAVVDKLTMMPCIRDSESDKAWKLRCATEAADYIPTTPWRYVLELPTGWLADQNVGDTLVLHLSVSSPELDLSSDE
jgi:uncharacterized membrane protein (UPF0127 family)